MSVFKTQIMPIQVIVEDNNIELALQQLHYKQYLLQATRWYKKRQGYYEKPAILKRKKLKMKRIVSQSQNWFSQCPLYFQSPANLWLKIDLAQQHQPTSNSFAVGR
ncbi:hypothetical protein [Acinetobacter sp. Marseille-Q1618]|uniref:hypothetical protein n=1 Tax=Acinetobacter sp. Marseille-Q1618 TaxID=2697502 RepID=UPI0020C583EA|nr:hypothetical protein [Acinetobacter sp. Marseille-Q1618]